jgi:hypothetical protein
MQLRIQIFSILLSVSLLFVIFQLIRKNKLLEQYSLLWIASAVLLFVMAVWKDLLLMISRWIGIYYPPSALFLLAVFCGMVIALHFSVVISKLRRQNNALAQEFALLRNEIDRLKKVCGLE